MPVASTRRLWSDRTVFGRKVDHRRWARRLWWTFLATAALFVLFPSIDLAVSSWFFRQGQGFPVHANPTAEALRWTIWRLSEGMLLVAVVFLIATVFRKGIDELTARHWWFVVLLYLLGPGILVNGLLKANWGRARPSDVAEFAGPLEFTPPLEVSDQCLRNCSFVSGEGAAAFAFAISMLILLSAVRGRMKRFQLQLAVGAALAVGIVGPLLRVMAGRHFLSDTLFAAIFTLAIALALHWALLRESAETNPHDLSSRR